MSLEFLLTKFNGLSLKERSLLTLMVIVAFFTAWDFWLYQPLVTESEVQQRKVDDLNETVGVLNVQLQAIINNPQQKKFDENRQRYAELVRQLGITDEKLDAITDNLIAPEAMADVLKTMLINSNNLQIRSLRGQGGAQIPLAGETTEAEKHATANTQTNGQAAQVADINNPGATSQTTQDIAKIDTMDNKYPHAWRHGFRLEFSGSYLNTLAYLQSLESLGWKFYWETLVLNADEYPTVETAIEVFTLSLDEAWLQAGLK